MAASITIKINYGLITIRDQNVILRKGIRLFEKKANSKLRKSYFLNREARSSTCQWVVSPLLLLPSTDALREYETLPRW